jgi:Transposase IS200 like
MLAYCLMPNHVHLIAVPQSADGLGRAIGEAHRRYTRMINFRERWRGHIWQGRFASFVLGERTDSFPIASSTLGRESSGEVLAEQLDDVLGYVTTYLNDLELPSPGSSAELNKTSNRKMRRKRMAKRSQPGSLIC